MREPDSALIPLTPSIDHVRQIKTLDRKIKEAITALKIEAVYSKQEILSRP